MLARRRMLRSMLQLELELTAMLSDNAITPEMSDGCIRFARKLLRKLRKQLHDRGIVSFADIDKLVT